MRPTKLCKGIVSRSPHSAAKRRSGESDDLTSDDDDVPAKWTQSSFDALFLDGGNFMERTYGQRSLRASGEPWRSKRWSGVV